MLAEKNREFKTLVVSLEQLVAEDNFYRKVEATLDLSFVRELVKDYYKPFGRSSIDPVVFFKLQLIMFFEGIRSERQLMTMVNMRLDHRWWIGYDLDEKVPDHSALSKIRDRYGIHIFQKFFECVVQKCVDAGLVWGREIYLDGTKVQANAAIDEMVPRWYWQAQRHILQLFASESVATDTESNRQDQATSLNVANATSVPEKFIEKYGKKRHTSKRRKRALYHRIADSQVSLTDPDATPMSRHYQGRAKLGYHTHYVVDGGKSRIILAALVTPASVTDNIPMLDLTRWVRFRWQLDLELAVGDTRYGTIENIIGLEHDGIKAYLPTPDFSKRNDFYSIEHFQYDAERDLFICPQGEELPLYKRSNREYEFVYKAKAKICNVCPIKTQCTKSTSGRHLRRSFFQEYLDRVQAYHKTEVYKKAMRKRALWPEGLFGEAKEWHQMRKYRLRRLRKVNMECLVRAAGQNIKRLLKAKSRRNPQTPMENAMLIPFTPPVLIPVLGY